MKFYARRVLQLAPLATSVLLVSACSVFQPSSPMQLTETAPTAPLIAKSDKAAAIVVEENPTPDVKTSVASDYKCELNDSLTLYTKHDDDNHATLRWKNKLYGLARVPTTTGANRFENRKEGLVWIGIPSKAMLLDSKRGVQLANECKIASK